MMSLYLQLQSAGNSRLDLSLITSDSDEEPGILWLLEECCLRPGATKQQFIEKMLRAHATPAKRREFAQYYCHSDN